MHGVFASLPPAGEIYGARCYLMMPFCGVARGRGLSGDVGLHVVHGLEGGECVGMETGG